MRCFVTIYICDNLIYMCDVRSYICAKTELWDIVWLPVHLIPVSVMFWIGPDYTVDGIVWFLWFNEMGVGFMGLTDGQGTRLEPRISEIASRVFG